MRIWMRWLIWMAVGLVAPALAAAQQGTVKQHIAKLTWPQSVSTNVVSYRIYRSTTSGSGYQVVETIPWQTNYYDDATVKRTDFRFCSNAVSSIGKIHLERPTVLPASVASENQTVTDCPC